MEAFQFTYTTMSVPDSRSGLNRKAIETLYSSHDGDALLYGVGCEVKSSESTWGRFHVKVEPGCFALLEGIGHILKAEAIPAKGAVFIDHKAIEILPPESVEHSDTDSLMRLAKQRVFFVSPLAAEGVVEFDKVEGGKPEKEEDVVTLDNMQQCQSVRTVLLIKPVIPEDHEYRLCTGRSIAVIPDCLCDEMVFVTAAQASEFLTGLDSFFHMMTVVDTFTNDRSAFFEMDMLANIPLANSLSSLVKKLNGFVNEQLKAVFGVEGKDADESESASSKQQEREGFAKELSSKNKDVFFPDNRPLKEDKAFFDSISRFSERLVEALPALEKLVYKLVYCKIVGKSSLLVNACDIKNTTVEMLLELERDGANSGLVMAMERFDDKFSDPEMTTEYSEEVPAYTGSHFVNIEKKILCYNTYLIQSGKSGIDVGFLSDFLSVFSFISGADVEYFLGKTPTAYLDGDRNSLSWNMESTEVSEFFDYMNLVSKDYDTVMYAQLCEQVKTLAKILGLFGNSDLPWGVFLQRVELFCNTELDDAVGDEFLKHFIDILKRESHGCTELVRFFMASCDWMEGNVYSQNIFYLSFFCGLISSAKRNEPIDNFISLLISNQFLDVVERLKEFVEFYENQ